KENSALLLLDRNKPFRGRKDSGPLQAVGERRLLAGPRVPETIVASSCQIPAAPRHHPFAVRRQYDPIDLAAVIEALRTQPRDGPFRQRIAERIEVGHSLLRFYIGSWGLVHLGGGVWRGRMSVHLVDTATAAGQARQR